MDPPEDGDSITLRIGTSMAQTERLLILATLRHYDHHKERTAAALGISMKTLYNRLKDYAADEARARQRRRRPLSAPRAGLRAARPAPPGPPPPGMHCSNTAAIGKNRSTRGPLLHSPTP